MTIHTVRRTIRRLSVRYLRGALLGLVALTLPGGLALSAQVQRESVADVRVDRDQDGMVDRVGDTVSVRGVALVASDVMNPGQLDFFLDDGTAGIGVFSFAGGPRVSRGALLDVTGVLEQYQGQAQIRPLRYHVLEDSVRPLPAYVALPPEPIDLEPLEGRRVRLGGHVLRVWANAGGHLVSVLPDGDWTEPVTVFTRFDSPVIQSLPTITRGDEIEAEGVLGQFTPEAGRGGYQLYLGSGEDIRHRGISRAFLTLFLRVAGVLALAAAVWSFALRRTVHHRTRELAESEARYRLLVDQAPGAVFIVRDDVIVYANPEARNLLGGAAGLSTDGDTTLGDLVQPSSLPALGPGSGGAARSMPTPALLKFRDGRAREVLVDSAPVPHFGKAAQQVWVQDMTEWNERDRERRRLENRVQQKTRLESLGVLAGGIAHDFNNILTSIMGNAGFLRTSGSLAEADRETAQDILDEAKRAAELTEQMLTFAGRSRVSREALDLGVVVDAALNLMSSSVPSSVTLTREIEPGCMVEADQPQLVQTVINLVRNALESFHRERERRIHVAVSTRRVSTRGTAGDLVPGRYATLRVTDSGSGMNPDTAARAFDPFFSTKFTGRGLGLAAVLGVARGLGGDVLLETDEGSGTSITVCIPSLVVPAAPRADLPVGPDPTAPPSPAAKALPGREGCILVVDDERTVREVLTRGLRRAGYEAEAVEDGARALAFLESDGHRTLAVILDVTMPGMDGLEVLESIRKTHTELPVILSSGYTQERIGDLDDPFCVFLHKPYPPARLVETLEPLLT